MHKYGIIGVLSIIIIMQLTAYTSGINPNSVKIQIKKNIKPNINKAINTDEYKLAKEIKDKFFEGCTPCKNNRLVQKDYKMVVHIKED